MATDNKSEFDIGDLVVYGTKGVCRVKNISEMKAPSGTVRDYYTLEPLFLSDSTIYSPVDNTKVIMRQVVTREYAMELIDDIPNIEILQIKDDKQREAALHDSVATCDLRELVKIIKTLYDRRKQREAVGKKATSVDEKYLKIAENNLYSELSIPLEIPMDEMEEYITSRINNKKKKKKKVSISTGK
ncbi:MAG: CarD family transcriptional regulator [Lachnospiraceae bacterium]|nr:CarD family transcriptional regulator [Lachnospiraceae bacterium]